MKKQIFRVDSDGYNGVWYPAPAGSRTGLILMLGDSAEDYMARIDIDLRLKKALAEWREEAIN